MAQGLCTAPISLRQTRGAPGTSAVSRLVCGRRSCHVAASDGRMPMLFECRSTSNPSTCPTPASPLPNWCPANAPQRTALRAVVDARPSHPAAVAAWVGRSRETESRSFHLSPTAMTSNPPSRAPPLPPSARSYPHLQDLVALTNGLQATDRGSVSRHAVRLCALSFGADVCCGADQVLARNCRSPLAPG